MMSTNTIITIPVYNGEKFIERTLKSCLDQTLPTEIWVIDNQSTDKTQQIVQTHAQNNNLIKLFINETNLGRVGNWNRCLELFEKSNYKYIKFLFAGDEILPDCIMECEKAFSIDKEIGAVVFPYEFVNLDGSKGVSRDVCPNRVITVHELNFINLENGGILGAIVCNCYNKKFINNYKFNEIFIGKADFDFFVLSTSKAYYIDLVLARFNLDSHRTFSSAFDYYLETEFAFNRSYWLEKLKSKFSTDEYYRIRKKILIDFVVRNFNYYDSPTFFQLLITIIILLPKRIAKDILKIINIKK